MSDTIYALSTPFYKSAIAIIRVSGNLAKNSLFKLTDIKKITPYKTNLCTLKNLEGQIIDKPLVVFFPQGASYTNEDIVEYHIHGSIAIIKELLATLQTLKDYRLAYAGEFTKRALNNNKLSLIESEALIDLINSETLSQKNQAIKILSGEIKSKYVSFIEIINENLAYIEAVIDFSEYELPENLLSNLNINIKKVKSSIKKELSTYKSIKKIKEGINITILGSPNVGKSSLINYLSNSDVSIISKISGTTRDVISSVVDFFGYSVKINDTAGLKVKTTDIIEKEGIKRAKNLAKNTDLKILIIDAKNFLETYKSIKPFVDTTSLIIINKIDLLNNLEKISLDNFIEKNLSEFDSKYILKISIIKKIGLKNLNQILKSNLNNITQSNESTIIVNERHNGLLHKVNDTLEEFLINTDIVIKSYNLKSSMDYIGEIMGYRNIENVLDTVFSKFCIGK